MTPLLSYTTGSISRDMFRNITTGYYEFPKHFYSEEGGLIRRMKARDNFYPMRAAVIPGMSLDESKV